MFCAPPPPAKVREVFSHCCWVAKSCPTLCDPMNCSTQASVSFTISHSLLKLMSIESVMPSNHLILCHHLFLLPSIFLSNRSFPVSQLFASDGQSIEVSASASVLTMNIWGWFPLGLTGLISLLSKRFSRVFSSTTIWKFQFFGTQPSLWSNIELIVLFCCLI